MGRTPARRGQGPGPSGAARAARLGTPIIMGEVAQRHPAP
jgi:hypothetical protein